MKLLIILLCTSITFADRHRNLMRNENQPIGNSDEDYYGSSVHFGIRNKAKVVTPEQYQADPEAYEKDVKSSGLWLQWNENGTQLPMFTVFGGIDEELTHFVMRAKHNESEKTFGKIVGSYEPNIKTAQISVDGKVFKKQEFELLLHTNHVWVHKSDTRPKIHGGNGFICRILMNDGRTWVIGNLDVSWIRTCKASYRDREVSDTNYQVLAFSCGSEVTRSNHLEKKITDHIVVSNEEYKRNQGAYSQYLASNAIWVQWNTELSYVMPNAVFGGYDSDGAYFIIMRETQDGTRVPGMYQPATQKAIVLDQGFQSVPKFYILVHEKSMFQPSGSSGVLVTVAPNIGYCQGRGKDLNILPGRVSVNGDQLGRCQLFQPGAQWPEYFNVLRNAC